MVILSFFMAAQYSFVLIVPSCTVQLFVVFHCSKQHCSEHLSLQSSHVADGIPVITAEAQNIVKVIE